MLLGWMFPFFSSLLALYHSSGIKYYNKSKFKAGMWKLFMEMRKQVGLNITQHVVQLFGTIWAWVDGIMASGAYCTSHGDSWCMAFLYIAFLFFQMEKYPNMLEPITNLMINGKIRAIFYGDDDELCNPQTVNDLVGQRAFSNFLALWSIKTRDVKEFRRYLTRISSDGEIVYEGPVFLKVYSISKYNLDVTDDVLAALPDVLPFRKFEQSAGKIAYGKGEHRSHGMTLLSIVGLVNTTYGTNLLAYNFFLVLFNSIRRYLPSTWYEDCIALYLKNGNMKELNAVLKTFSTLNVSRDFPSQESLLMRNKMHRETHYLSSSKSFFSYKC